MIPRRSHSWWCVLSSLLVLPGLPLSAQPAAKTPAANSEQAEGFVPLFNGHDLSGWTTSANLAAWTVQGGEIVIKPDAPGGGWWLRTEKQYRDFELRLEFSTSPKGNSGVGLRGSSTGDPAFTGMEIQIYDTVGEEPKLTNCGAVYDAIAPTAMMVRKPGEWNEYRILLVGDTLNVWLNGTQIHKDQKLDDRGYVHKPEDKSPLANRLPTGYIALQEHGDPVKFRNIRIKDLSPDPDPGAFVPLFNNKDLTGWTARGGGTWKIEDGVLVGRDGPGHLFHERAFSDLEFRAFVKVSEKGNSGMYFRAATRPEDPNTWPQGYEAQVDNHDPKNFTGSIYDRAWPGVKAPITRDEAWFDYRVRADGEHIQTWINGKPMTDAMLKDFAKGQIALQTHNPGNVIMYKDIQVRELASTKPHARAGTAAEPIRVFYCTQSAGYKHEVLPLTRELMNRFGTDLPWLEVRTSDSISDLTEAQLAQTDIVMLYTTGALPMGDMKSRLLSWISDGGGLVGVHSATDTLADDAEYVATIGGTFESHPWNQSVRVLINDNLHPATRPLYGEKVEGCGVADGHPYFTITDEIYQFKHLNPNMHVLLSLDPKTNGAEPSRPYPLAWTLQIGKGRVFYTALGHGPDVWRNQRYIDHVLEGIRWAAGMQN